MPAIDFTAMIRQIVREEIAAIEKEKEDEAREERLSQADARARCNELRLQREFDRREKKEKDERDRSLAEYDILLAEAERRRKVIEEFQSLFGGKK